MPTEATRQCFWMQVNPEKPEQFLAYHEQVWSEMPRALESTGWVNYSIFEDTCGLLVGFDGRVKWRTAAPLKTNTTPGKQGKTSRTSTE